MIVYRLENKEKIGPYQECVPCLLDHSEDNGHPLLFNEGHEFIRVASYLKTPLEDIKYGFASMESLKRWFTLNEINSCNKRGYEIVKVKVHKLHTFETATQLVFNSNKITEYV